MAGLVFPLCPLLAAFFVTSTESSMVGYGGINPEPKLIWCTSMDSVLIGHMFGVAYTNNSKLCWNACRAQQGCVSANFALGSGRCELNNATHCDHTDRVIIERPRWLYIYTQTQARECTAVPKPTVVSPGICSAEEPNWPSGVYGLPKPTYGCPVDTTASTIWQTGYRFHDTEDTASANEWSSNLHLMGSYSPNNMYQHFCMKTVDCRNGVGWPQGQYCIFKYNTTCPAGMSSGSVFWDDEDNGNINTVDGTFPSGRYDLDTRIDYCCMVHGNASRPIVLPTLRPFYLFPFTEQCQEVDGMTVTREWFKWDNENSNGQTPPLPEGNYPFHEQIGQYPDIRMYYCYYEA